MASEWSDVSKGGMPGGKYLLLRRNPSWSTHEWVYHIGFFRADKQCFRVNGNDVQIFAFTQWMEIPDE